MTDQIAAAIAHIRSVTPINDPWRAEDFESSPSNSVDASIATILNAVVSGRLTPADALEAERERAGKAEAERDAWIETARLHSKAEAAFLAWLRSAGEHMRAFGVTICDDGSDAGKVLVAKVPECAKAMAGRITDLEAERDQALARLAAAHREAIERCAALLIELGHVSESGETLARELRALKRPEASHG